VRFPQPALLTSVLTTAVLTTAVASAAMLVAPPSAAAPPAVARLASPAVVLVNRPVTPVCAGHQFTVGVWYQQISGGSRAYRISIWGPRHRRFFYRHGRASAKNWRFWHVTAGRKGRYRVVYAGHRPGQKKWSRYRVIVRAKHCKA
jgi:hypothetical protein